MFNLKRTNQPTFFFILFYFSPLNLLVTRGRGRGRDPALLFLENQHDDNDNCNDDYDDNGNAQADNERDVVKAGIDGAWL